MNYEHPNLTKVITMAKTIEARATEQRKIDIEKACDVYKNELTQIIDLLNKFGENYGIDKLGELLSFDGCVKDFKEELEKEI